MSSRREHYPIECRLHGRERLLLWYSDDVDGVIVGSDGRLVTFDSTDSAVAYAQTRGLSLSADAPVVYDLDQLRAWTSSNTQAVDCRALLDCWNLFADVAECVPEHGDAFRAQDRAGSSVYEKLFYGNNLPAITPSGRAYEPVWSEAEIAQLSAVARAGIELMQEALAGGA